MKVLYSCVSKSWGGLEMRTIQGVEQLLKKGLDVDLLCYPNSIINNEASSKNINCITFKAMGYFHPMQIIRLSKVLDLKNYQIIHSQYSKDLWLIVPALKLAGLKTKLLLSKRMESSVIKKDFLHKWIYNRVNLILAISSMIKTNVIQTCPVPENKVILFHNGVDLQKFNPELTNRIKIRNEFGIKDDEIVIGMLARLSFGKGHEEFFLAAKKINNEYDKIKFLVAGNSDQNERNYEEKIYKIVEEYNLSGKVIFTGFREDTPDILSAMDIFAFPSHSESFGNALIEAMAMEKPSVSTNSHGILDIAVDGETGLLFERKNADDLYKKLKFLIDSPDKRNKFGCAARKHVVENFDIEKRTVKLIELYKKLLIKN